MSNYVLASMYFEGDVLHCKPYTEAERSKARGEWQIITDKKAENKKIIRGLGKDGKYFELGDTDFDWDGETAITVEVNYGIGAEPRLYLSHKYRSGMITVTTRSGKKMDVLVTKCVRRSMADIMDEMLAKPGFDRLWFIEEIMA